MKGDGVCMPLSVLSAQGGSSGAPVGRPLSLPSCVLPSCVLPSCILGQQPPQGLGTVAVGTSPLRTHVLTEFSD